MSVLVPAVSQTGNIPENGQEGRAVDCTGPLRRGDRSRGTGTPCPQPAGLLRGVRSRLAPHCCRRSRRSWGTASQWSPVVASRTAGAALERSSAVGVGGQWVAARLASLDPSHASWRRFAGAGDQDLGSRRRRRCSHVSPWRNPPPPHPLARLPGTVTRPSSWRCPTRFSGPRGRWEGRSGSCRPGAAGQGWAPWLACIPWLLAAALSLLLVSTWRWPPRRLLLAAGWSATAVVAMIGPAACWSLVTTLVGGRDPGLDGIATWVPCLFYGSWLLWAIAAGAATRSYQLRIASLRISSPA